MDCLAWLMNTLYTCGKYENITCYGNDLSTIIITNKNDE